MLSQIFFHIVSRDVTKIILAKSRDFVSSSHKRGFLSDLRFLKVLSDLVNWGGKTRLIRSTVINGGWEVLFMIQSHERNIKQFSAA